MDALSISPRMVQPVLAEPENRSLLMQALRRRLRLSIAVFAALFGLTAIVTLLLPKNYEGSMEFLVSNERLNNPISQEKNTQAIVYLDDISEARINTEVAILTSNDLLLQVVRKCGLDNDVKGQNLSASQRVDMALSRLRDDLVVAPLKRAAIIRVSYKSSDPARSVEVLSALSQLYLDSHLRLGRSGGSYAFFADMWQKSAQELSVAQSQLSKFKDTHNIISLPEEKTLALQNEAELERRLTDAQAQAKGTANQSAKLLSLISSTPETIVRERRAVPNQYEMQQLSTLLTELENKRIEAASRYLPEDRFVKDLDDQIAETKSALSAATTGTTEEVSTVANPVAVDAKTESMRTQYARAGFEAQASELREQLAISRNKLGSLDSQTGEYNSLVENVSRLSELERDYHQKADAAQVDVLLDQKHISNVAVAEEPHASGKPTSPRVPVILGLGAAWSGLFAVGVAMFAERRRTPVTSALDIEKSLGVPVLALVSVHADKRYSAWYLPDAILTKFPHSSTDLRRTS
jgi:uncharacterized protein involved in exopolysaccharide biosynthesis